ncbi:hypothetical protein thsrh120_02480 [Rhizobium sp. No.120]
MGPKFDAQPRPRLQMFVCRPFYAHYLDLLSNGLLLANGKISLSTPQSSRYISRIFTRYFADQNLRLME